MVRRLTLGRVTMMDFAFAALTAILLASTWGLVRLCARVG
jgi:hypothetical protein